MDIIGLYIYILKCVLKELKLWYTYFVRKHEQYRPHRKFQNPKHY